MVEKNTSPMFCKCSHYDSEKVRNWSVTSNIQRVDLAYIYIQISLETLKNAYMTLFYSILILGMFNVNQSYVVFADILV